MGRVSEQVFGRSAPQQQDAQSVQPSATRATGDGFDELLDSIDAVLEANAEDYVRSFVQKGGQ